MTNRKQALTDLLAKVEAGEAFRFDAPQRAERVAEYECLEGYYQYCMAYGAFHGSLDAAKALHEAMLPGWDWSLTRNAANVYLVERPHDGNIHSATADCPARAWLIAILKALIAEDATQ